MSKPQKFFYIYKSGERDGKSGYPSLAQASLAWEENPNGREVVREDSKGNVEQRYTAHECREAVRKFKTPKVK